MLIRFGMIELEGGHAGQFLSLSPSHLNHSLQGQKTLANNNSNSSRNVCTSHTAFLRIVPFDQDLHGHSAEKAAREEGTNKK